MTVKYERVIDGLLRYLNKEIYPTMSELQMFGARLAVARMVKNKDTLRVFLTENPFLKTFSIMDSEGNVDIDDIACILKEQLSEIGKIRIDTKIFGAYTFYPDDVDKLVHLIKEV
jgi:hypothetical protein